MIRLCIVEVKVKRGFSDQPNYISESQIVGPVSQTGRVIKAVSETAPTYSDQGPLNLGISLMYRDFSVGDVEVLRSFLLQNDMYACHSGCSEVE